MVAKILTVAVLTAVAVAVVVVVVVFGVWWSDWFSVVADAGWVLFSKLRTFFIPLSLFWLMILYRQECVCVCLEVSFYLMIHKNLNVSLTPASIYF